MKPKLSESNNNEELKSFLNIQPLKRQRNKEKPNTENKAININNNTNIESQFPFLLYSKTLIDYKPKRKLNYLFHMYIKYYHLIYNYE